MKIDEILEMWSTDSKIDVLNLTNESYNIGAHHHKYYKILMQERLLLLKYQAELKTLKQEKYDFYTQGPSDQDSPELKQKILEQGWTLPAKGKILKAEIERYLESDKDIINLSLKIGVQSEKVGLLVDIIRVVINRNYTLRIALDNEKFKAGS